MSTVHPAPSTRPRAQLVAYGVAALALVLAAVAIVWAINDDGVESMSALRGSGVAAVETRELEPFAGVELLGVNAVTIGVGGEQSVVVRGDDNLVPLVATDVQDGVLVISETESFETVTPLTVEITVPTLDDVVLAGAGSITIDGHDLPRLSVALPGSGTIAGAGSATSLEVDLSGSGNIDLGMLVARDATVNLYGSGNVLVHVTGALAANVSGSGSVTYTGDPGSVTESVTGSGSISGK